MNRNNFSIRHAGFSLIEIIIVITLIGLIVGWAATQLFGKQDQALWRAAKAQLTQLGGELDRYKLDTGRYPTTQEGLQALVKQPRRGQLDRSLYQGRKHQGSLAERYRLSLTGIRQPPL